jgi:glucosamine--fructose-6-phosphate aminotransferase (isomerizing)
MLADLFAQPEALHRTLAALKTQTDALATWRDSLVSGRLRGVIFTGMGGSFGALFPSVVQLVRGGFTALALETSELLTHYHPLLNMGYLGVVVSQSGQSVEIVRLLDLRDANALRDAAASPMPLIGVTNTADSPLAQRSNAHLLMAAGSEHTVSTKTYTCTLATLHVLSAALTGTLTSETFDQLMTAANTIAVQLPVWDARLEALTLALEACRTIIVLGRGEARASALAGALVIKETAKIPSEGMVGGQFRHGPLEIISPEIGIIIIANPHHPKTHELDYNLAQDLAAKGAPVVYISAADDTPAGTHPVGLPSFAGSEDGAVRALVEVVPMQLLAAKLAQRRGIEPGTFYHGGKVTLTE